MSYIRCLSNPERLYIWYDVDGSIYISAKKDRVLKMPPKVFHTLLARWWRNGWEDVKFEGGSLTLDHGTWKWLLHYRGWAKPVAMYEVTLYYLAHDVVLLLARVKRKKQR